MSLSDEFFAEECDDHVRAVLLNERSRRESGSRYFTFNRFNVKLDFDSATAIIEDELDPASNEAMGLPEFFARLEA